MPINNKKNWTNKEDKKLINLYGVKTYKEIGQELGRTKDAVESRIRKLKEEGKVINNRLYKTREMKFKEQFETMYPGFKYHSEYKNVDKPFKSKCKICGYIQERNGQCTRPKFIGTTLVCDNCNEVRRVENEIKKEEEAKLKEEQHIKEKLLQILTTRIVSIEREQLLQKICSRCNKKYKAYRKDSVHCDECLIIITQEREDFRKQWEGKTIECDECGNEFVMKTYNSKYCSLKCLNRAMDRIQEVRKRKRLRHNGEIDNSITLSKLIIRDKNTCKICGETVNEKDYRIDGKGSFIVGEKYPSIDHIVPISKGGTHTWNNVQLAHHQCNSIKNDNIYKEVEDSGQLRVI